MINTRTVLNILTRRSFMTKIALLATVLALVVTTNVSADMAAPAKAVTAPAVKMNEAQFKAALSPEAKVMYDNLDAEGKASALKMANEGKDKNEAVKEASKKMVETKATETMKEVK